MPKITKENLISIIKEELEAYRKELAEAKLLAEAPQNPFATPQPAAPAPAPAQQAPKQAPAPKPMSAPKKQVAKVVPPKTTISPTPAANPEPVVDEKLKQIQDQIYEFKQRVSRVYKPKSRISKYNISWNQFDIHVTKNITKKKDVERYLSLLIGDASALQGSLESVITDLNSLKALLDDWQD
jgi:hypothetical protein